MISKKFIIFPIVFGFTSISLFLTSCAQVSQYEPIVELNIDDPEFKIKDKNDSTKDVAKYATTIGSGQLKVYQRSTEIFNWNIASINDKKNKYFLPLSVNVVYPLINLANKLVNVSHIPSVFGDPNSLFRDNLIFENNNNKNLEEFLYASSNTLNQGRKNQIKLYLSEMNITSINGDSTKNLINDRKSDTTLNVEIKETTIKKNDKKELWIYQDNGPTQITNFDNNNEYKLPYSGKAYEENKTKKFNVSFKYNYYNPEDSSIDKKPIKDIEQINKYISSNSAWNWGNKKVENYEFKINLNVQVELRTEYSFFNYVEIDKNKSDEEKTKEKNKLSKVTKTMNGSPKYSVNLPKFEDEEKDKNVYVNFSNFGVQFMPINSKTNSFLDDLKNNAGMNGEFKDNSSTLLSWIKEDKLPTSFYITSSSQQNELIEKIKKFKNTISL